MKQKGIRIILQPD